MSFSQNTCKEGGISMKYTGQYWTVIVPFMRGLMAEKYGRKAAREYIAPILQGMFCNDKLPNWMNRRVEKRSPEVRAYYDKMLPMFGMRPNRQKPSDRPSAV
ncbi:MAG: hypothetical protein LUF28_06405 [Clostridiales bacterium]|nr:hypothetical protein [Clostridiales bacterium]